MVADLKIYCTNSDSWWLEEAQTFNSFRITQNQWWSNRVYFWVLVFDTLNTRTRRSEVHDCFEINNFQLCWCALLLFLAV